jgi:hypothetical protein
MRYATAVHRLVAIAEGCDRLRGLLDLGTLSAVYAYGQVLDAPGADLPVVQVAFAVDLADIELPWGVEPPECTTLVALLRLDKVPVERAWRAAARPVQNHVIRRPLRIWTSAGPDYESLEALAAGHAEQLRLPSPDPTEEATQYEQELTLSLTHLRSVRDRYWEDRDWRRTHRGRAATRRTTCGRPSTATSNSSAPHRQFRRTDLPPAAR